jgi:hypothetical protein
VKEFENELGRKPTKQLLKAVNQMGKKIDAAKTAAKPRKARKQLRRADRVMKKFLKRLEKLRRKDPFGPATQLMTQAQAIHVLIQAVTAELSS